MMGWKITVDIAQYLRRLLNNIDHGNSQSRPALRVTEKKFPLILDRESQSYLSWFIVSLDRGLCEVGTGPSIK